MKTQYEWDVETVTEDEFKDIESHNFSDTLAPLLRFLNTPEPGYTKALVLVRDETDNFGDGLERSWAYVKDGKLPEHFEDSGGRPMAKVPKRFHAEFARVSGAIKTSGNPPASLVRACERHADKIERVDDEGEDGYWIYLRAGWWNREASTTGIHERNVRDCINAMAYIERDPRPEHER